MLSYELINQIKDIQSLESLSVQAWEKYHDFDQYKSIENDANHKWSQEIKCDKDTGLAQLRMNIGSIQHLKELDLNLAG